MKIASVLLITILLIGCSHSQVIEKKPSEDAETFVGATFTIIDTDLKEIERKNGYVNATWKVKLKNNTDKQVTVGIRINYVDKDDWKLDSFLEQATLKPHETKTISDTKMIREDIWFRMYKYLIQLERQ